MLCPPTRFPYTLASALPDGTRDVSVVLPRWIVMKREFERVYEACCATPPCTDTCPALKVALGEDFDGNGTPEATVNYEVFSGIGLACADKAYRPFLLHPIDGPEVQALVADPNPPNALKIPTFGTYFRYLCLKTWDPAQGKEVFVCGKGRVADGISGYALKNNTLSPRPIYSKGLIWGGNTWDLHFQFVKGHLGSIIEPKQNNVSPAYYALDDAWNLNPLDKHSDNVTTKEKDYLAAGQALMGMNLGDNAPRRCPSFITCEPGKACCIGRFGGGVYGSCAVKTDGTVWCWGDVYGHFAAVPRQPVRTSTGQLEGALDVSVGEAHACARRGDGTLWCWGNNSYGQLGDGGTVSRSTAAPVAGLSAVEQVSLGAYQSCARLTNGTLRCWGGNAFAQLGLGASGATGLPTATVPACGDGVCDFAEKLFGSCVGDCTAILNDGVCDPFMEVFSVGCTGSTATCSPDCRPVGDPLRTVVGNLCGNGRCDTAATESSATCATDCGALPAVCGNGQCEAGESCSSCGADCGVCCTPSCAGKVCGNNGCGGSCGSCTSPATCDVNGQCVGGCTPATCATLAQPVCGAQPDGCGGTLSCTPSCTVTDAETSNNAYGGASALTSAAIYTPKVGSSGDQDWWKMSNLSAGKVVNVTMRPPAGKNYNIEIRTGSTGTTVVATGASGGAGVAESLSWTNGSRQTVYVRVVGATTADWSATDPYYLKVTF